MSFFCKCFLAANLCFLGANENAAQENVKTIIYQGKHLQVIVPDHPLAKDSLIIEPIRSHEGEPHRLSDWTLNMNAEMYDLAQKIVKIWNVSRLADNYMIFGREDIGSSAPFKWEIVPYPNEGWTFWKQFNVIWNVMFGSDYVNPTERSSITQKYDKYKNEFSMPLIRKKAAVVQCKDPFCNPDIVEKQRVFEGKLVNVLYNYAPLTIGEGKLHFLLIPKEHREKFSDLTKDEYLEISELRSKLLRYYQSKGYPVAYVYNKSGHEAGQTVPHFHEHVILTASKTQEVIGKLRVLKNMLFGPSKLPDDELKQKVSSLKKDLAPVFKAV